MTYDVSTVSRLTGIPRATLLAWERRYAVVRPRRLSNGYRAYSERDVEMLNQVKALTDAGHRVGEAVRIAGGVAPVERTVVDELIDALKRFDRARVDLLGARVAEQGMPARLERVIEPVLARMDEGGWTEAQRRFGEAWVRMRAQGMLAMLGWGPTGRAPLVVARADDRTAAGLVDQLQLVLNGHSVLPVGVAPTTAALAETAQASGACAVCIGGVDEADGDWLVDLDNALEVPLIAIAGAFSGVKGVQFVRRASEIERPGGA